MIEYREGYQAYITEKKVGSNDKVADSVKSYISYLDGVTKHTGIDITRKTLSTEKQLDTLSGQCEGKVEKRTISNYRTAMRHYVNFVNERTGLSST